MADLIIRNGRLVTPSGIIEGDLAIEGEKIISIGKCGKSTQEIDAKAGYVLPGLIDAHVHLLCSSWGAVSANDYFKGTVAAALGGVTTFIDFAGQTRGFPMRKAIDDLKAKAEGNTVVDYGLHVSITDDSPTTLAEIEQVIAGGIPSFKMFMTYRSHNIMVDDDMMLRICERVMDAGGLPGVHAENDSMASANYARFTAQGKLQPKYHALAKPPHVEAEAINRALYIARIAKSPLYIYHLSTKAGGELVKTAYLQHQKVLAETCLHFLALTEEKLDQPDGERYICSPPLRTPEDQQALWNGIQERIIQVVSTDDAAFNAVDKKKALGGPLENIPNGLPGIGTRLPVLYSLGVLTGRISLERFVEINCENPARIFGMYPRKGALLPGSDADLIIIDPTRFVELNPKTQNMPVDWCPYDGLKVTGFPRFTFCRGEMIVRDYAFCGQKGSGRFIAGMIEPKILDQFFL